MQRDLFLLSVEQAAELEGGLGVPCTHFVCLLVWNADKVAQDEIERVSTNILSSGAACVCVWGQACERVHDVVDRVFVESIKHDESIPPVMTTWHAGEPLSEAIWFALFTAFPDDAFAETCRATLAIVVGDADFASEVRAAFADPAGFSERVLSKP
jgi:DNA gyrase inhibitor GyrI